jgi:hypothetical protein
MIKCTTCRKDKHIIHFTNNNKQYKKCDQCRDNAKKWRERNRERVSEYNKLSVLKRNNKKDEIEVLYGKEKNASDNDYNWKKYESQVDAANKLNLHKPNINKVIKGKLKSTGGYVFKLVKEKKEKEEIKTWEEIKQEKSYGDQIKGKPSQHRVLHETKNNIKGKICCCCKDWQPLTEFNKSSTHWDNLRNDCKLCLTKYRKDNRKIIAKKHLEYEKKRKANDPEFKLIKILRSRIGNVLRKIKNAKKCDHTMELTGCSLNFLKKHIEDQFTDGMTWENHGIWHLDHIRPCSSFDLTKDEEQRECFHYKNLQPLWGPDNLAKGSKDPIIWKQSKSQTINI